MQVDPDVLLANYRGWLLKTAQELAPRRSCDWRDLAQEGWIAMWRALRTYDPALGAEVSYLTTAARMRMVDCLRRNLWTGTPSRRGHVREAPATPVDTAWDWVDAIASEAQVYQDLDEAYHRGQIFVAVNQLTPAQRRYVYLRFWAGYRHADLIEAFGYDPRGLWDTPPNGAKCKLRESLAVLAL